MKKGLTKRLLAVLLSLMVLIGAVPMNAFAAEYDATKSMVHVVVENTTYAVADGAPWDGVLVDEWVELTESSTMMNCIVAALTENNYSQVGAESNYISSINGLSERDGGSMSGWMGTLNDWFTNQGFGAYTVANGGLTAYDEIRIMYTCNGYGEDLGGSFSLKDTRVKAIATSVGTLSPEFDKDTHEYTLTVPAGTTAVQVEPTAVNRNYQVRDFVGETYYKRTQMIPVQNGTVINVKCGDPSWPGMTQSTGANEYSLTVAVEEPMEEGVTEERVKVRAQMENMYLLPPDQEFTVRSNKAEQYGYTDAVTEGVSALDVMVTVHEYMFGEDYTIAAKDDYLKVESGFVRTLFGNVTNANGFLVNTGYPNDGTASAYGGYNGTLINQTRVTTGDMVEFVTYGDTDYYSDYYSFTSVPEHVYTGLPFEATVKGTMYMAGYMYADPAAFKAAAEPVEDAGLGWMNIATGEITPIEGAVTGEDGKATITGPAEAGTYYLTAISTEDAYVFVNPTLVEVEEAPITDGVETTISLSSTSPIAKLYAEADTEKTHNFLASVEAVNASYTTMLAPGTYILEGYANASTCNGSMKIKVSEANHEFKIWTVTAYCSTSGWTYGTDYTIENLMVLSGGGTATENRESTIGDSTTAGRKTFLVMNGDSYSFFGTPIGEKADSYAPTYKYGTVTGTNYTTATFTMAEKRGLSVTIPFKDADADGKNDYTLEVGQMMNYYIFTYLPYTSDEVNAEAQTETTTYETAKSGVYYYRVTNQNDPDSVTYGNWVTTSNATTEVTVTNENLYVGNSEINQNTVAQNFEYNNYDTGDIYLNVNAQSYLNLSVNETFHLYPYRNWLAIEGIMNAKVIEPDFHVEVVNISGENVVSVQEMTADDASKHSYMLTAQGEGTAIVLVTYDAMSNAAGMGGSFFSAIWPQNTGVFVVTVGAQNGVETGMTINEGKNILPENNRPKLSGDMYDAELDVLYYVGNEGASYSFTPEEGASVSIAKGDISTGKLTFAGFTPVAAAEDGSVTLTGLTAGKHIVKVEKDGKVEYQVIRSMKTSYKAYKGTAVDETQLLYDSETGTGAEGITVKANDKITIKFDRIYHPANKFSGIYNMSASINLNGEDGTAANGTANQYVFASTAAAQTVTFTVPKYWTEDSYTLTGAVRSSGFGSSYGMHRIVTYEGGKTPNFTAGSYTGLFGQIPAITIPLEPTNFLTGHLTLKDNDGETVALDQVSITLKDSDGNAANVSDAGDFGAVAGEYSYVIKGEGFEYKIGSVTLTDDGENQFEIVLQKTEEGTWDGMSFTEPAKDENGVYLISTGNELAWIKNEVNVTKTKNIKAKLTADINLGYYPWDGIGTTSNTIDELDGDGHKVFNLNATGSYAALIGVLKGTVKNITVEGVAEATGTSGGIVAYAQGTSASYTKIINCVSDVDIKVVSGTSTVGGIAGYTYYANIDHCVSKSNIVCQSSGASKGYGGIVGYMMNYPSTIDNCKNEGNISGKANVGGLVGYAGGAKPVITNSYSTGDVSGTDAVGGVIGDAAGAVVKNAYSTGEVKGSTNVGAAVGKNAGACTNVYYLNTMENPSGLATGLSEEEMKSADLGEAYGTCCGAYPALTWEDVEFHSKDFHYTVASTCTEKGHVLYLCSKCGEIFKDTYVAELGHDPEITDPHVGYGYGECKRCGEALEIWDDERLQSITYPQVGVTAIGMSDNGAYPWVVNNDRLESSNIGKDNTTSETSFTVTTTADTKITFTYGVSSEARYDKLTITAVKPDGTTDTIANAISGSEEHPYELAVAAGTTTITMKFVKDSSSAGGTDRAWVADLTVSVDNANDVVAAIDALPAEAELTLEDAGAVAAARQSYDALGENSKAAVTNLDKLTAAEAKIAELQAAKEAADAAAEKLAADTAAAEPVIAAINELPAVAELTLEDKEDAANARLAYTALTDDQKALVTNLETLEAVEAKLDELQAEKDAADQAAAEKLAADTAAANAAAEKVSALPAADAMTLETIEADKAKIEEARNAYEALTDDQKALVSEETVAALEAAEEKLAANEAEKKAIEDAEKAAAEKAEKDAKAAATVEKLIKALPKNMTVDNLDDVKESVESVRDAYNDLTEDQKALVKNADKLEEAEAKIAELEAEKKAIEEKYAADKAEAEKVEDQIAALPAAEDMTVETIEADKAAIEAAREAYDALTEDQKALVDEDAVADLEAAEEAAEKLQEIKDKEENLPFVDVKDTAWYKDAVAFVYARGIITGTDATHFSPDQNVSRAQFAVMMYRMAGEPEVEFKDQFEDVKDGQWYSKAVIWAYENEIIKGYENGKFGTNDKLTREQFAVMLCRYEKNINGGDTTVENAEELLKEKFLDASMVSKFAVNELAWCVSEGIISGNKTDAGMNISPRDKASRAQVATMIMRYMQ